MYHVGINHIIQIQFFPQASVCYPKKEGKKVKIQKKKIMTNFSKFHFLQDTNCKPFPKNFTPSRVCLI